MRFTLAGGALLCFLIAQFPLNKAGVVPAQLECRTLDCVPANSIGWSVSADLSRRAGGGGKPPPGGKPDDPNSNGGGSGGGGSGGGGDGSRSQTVAKLVTKVDFRPTKPKGGLEILVAFRRGAGLSSGNAFLQAANLSLTPRRVTLLIPLLIHQPIHQPIHLPIRLPIHLLILLA